MLESASCCYRSTAARCANSIPGCERSARSSGRSAPRTTSGTCTAWSVTSSSARRRCRGCSPDGSRPGSISARRRAGAELVEQWAAASTAAVEALTAADSLDAQRSKLPDGRSSAEELGWRLATDLTVHAWDLARAIDAPDEFPNDLLAHILEHAKQSAGPVVPAGALCAADPGAGLHGRPHRAAGPDGSEPVVAAALTARAWRRPGQPGFQDPLHRLRRPAFPGDRPLGLADPLRVLAGVAEGQPLEGDRGVRVRRQAPRPARAAPRPPWARRRTRRSW